ncbi:interleukin-21 receptor [Gastrophryne carolinensis]
MNMKAKEKVTLLFFSLCYMTALVEGCEDLLCYVDYLSTLTCRYSHKKENFNTVSQTLYARWSLEGQEEDCDLNQSEEEHEYTCSIDMESFSVDTECKIFKSDPRDGNLSDEICKTFNIGDKFKPVAPINLTVSLSKDVTLSWETEYDMDILRNDELAYEVSYKKEDETWLSQRTVQILENEKSLVLLRSIFQADEMYVARIRARPKKTSIYSGYWSNWSAQVSWRSPADERSLKDWIISLIVLVPALIVTITLIIFKRQKWSLWKNVWVMVPNPASFFKPLYADHHGSFKSWLGYPTTTFAGSLDFPEVYPQGILKRDSCLDLSNMEKQKLLVAIPCSSKDSKPCRKCDCSNVLDKSSASTTIDAQPSQSTTNGHEAKLDESRDDGYPSVNLDSDSSSSTMDSMHVSGENVEVTLSVNLNVPQRVSPLPLNINILDLLPIRREEWLESSNQEDDEDENVFYNNYNALSPDSGTSDDFGYPRICLDLDTIDSGFCDSECGSPVDFGNNDMEPKPTKSDLYSREDDLYEKNYVKQWIPSDSVAAGPSVKS